MAYLSVKLDHVAALRQMRKGKSPEPAHAAMLAEAGGADSITVHMRQDRRHIRERDLYLLKETVGSRLTVEIAPTEENVGRIVEVKPNLVVLIPEIDREKTTQSGLLLEEDAEIITEMVHRLQEVGISVAVHVEPSPDIIKRAVKIGVDAVKLHTGFYANAVTDEDGLTELDKIDSTTKTANKAGLMVLAGQGLTAGNILPLLKRGGIDEYIVGREIVERAVMVGMEKAVQHMRDTIRYGVLPVGE